MRKHHLVRRRRSRRRELAAVVHHQVELPTRLEAKQRLMVRLDQQTVAGRETCVGRKWFHRAALDAAQHRDLEVGAGAQFVERAVHPRRRLRHHHFAHVLTQPIKIGHFARVVGQQAAPQSEQVDEADRHRWQSCGSQLEKPPRRLAESRHGRGHHDVVEVPISVGAPPRMDAKASGM